MTKLDKLRATVEAMTAAPWTLSDHPEFVNAPDGGGPVCDTYGNHNDVANAAGIVALRNAAPALLEVIRLAGEWAKARDKFGCRHSSSSDDRFESAGDSLVGALTQLEELLP